MSYKLQGEIDFQGLKIKVENRKGSIRSGVDKDGNKWSIKMEFPYGYIARTEGTDGEGVDCFIGDNRESQKVFVIHIQNPETGEYDEDKVMLGFDTMQEARDAFLKHYDTYTFLQDITYMPLDVFINKLKKREGKMLKAVANITKLFKGIKVPDLLTLDLFARNNEEQPQEGKTVSKRGKNYKYARSKKNPNVLRLFKEDQISLFGVGEKDEQGDLFEEPKKQELNFDKTLVKQLKEKAKDMNNLEFYSFFVDNFVAKQGNRDTASELGKILGIKGKPDIDKIYLKLTEDSIKDSNTKKVALTDGTGKMKEIDSTGFEKPEEPKEKSIAEKEREKYFRNTVYGRNYRNLKKVLPNLDSIAVGEHFKVKSGSYMDFSVEGYGTDKHGRRILSIGHFGVQNGDLMSDPRMEIAIDTKNKVIEALTYENHYMGAYKEVYDDMFEQSRVNLKEKQDQNSFLRTWIKNLIEQGFQFKGEQPDAPKPKPTEPTAPATDTAKNDRVPKDTKINVSQPKAKEIENVEYTEVKGKKKRANINEQVKKLLEEKEDHEFTMEDKQLLIQYTGRGGLADKDTEADKVSLNEFYTLPKVTEFMWKSLFDLGFTGGRVLEPSSGTGNFLHNAPGNALITAVEIENTSGRIADILYGHQHDVRIESFEQFVSQSTGGEFDCVIGNAPFGDRGETMIYDPAKRDVGKHEQYFIDRGIDELKTDGIMAMIVPTGIMDNQLAKWRLDINKKAEFLGAIRMPTGAFKHANAQVTTDIVFFRKRPAEIIERMNNLKEGELDKLFDAMIIDPQFINGNYFEKNPQYALGTKTNGMFGMQIWEGELNVDELDGMRNLLKKDRDVYEDIFPDVAVSKNVKTELNVGDIKNLNGRMYRLNENHRWERITEEQLEQYTDIPEEIKQKLGISNLAELNAIENDVAKIIDLNKEQINFLSGRFGERLKKELTEFTGKGDHRDEMLKRAVVLGLAIRDFQLDLQNRKISSNEAQVTASQLGILVNQFVELYGNPTSEAKLTSYLGRTENNPILYLAGAVDLGGKLSRLFTDPFAYTNIYKETQNIGDYDPDSLYSIAQYLTNNSLPGTFEAISELYTGEESNILHGLLSSEDIFLDENLNFAPLHEVCVGEVYARLDSWKKRREEIAGKLPSANDEEKILLNLEDNKLENQIFELERRAQIRGLDYLPVSLADAGKVFDINILNEYLELQLGAGFADKIVYDEKLKMFVPQTGIMKEFYILYTQKGGLETDEKARLKELARLYFNKNENPFYFAMINNLNGINTQWSKNDAEKNRAELKRINSDFINYIKGVENSDKIADSYNRLYNNYIQKSFDSSPIEGLSKFAYDKIVATTADGRQITAREKAGEHVWSTARRMYEQGKGLIAHGVGLGKTLEAIIITLLHKESGRAKKPLIVTPKSVLKNWVNEIEKWTEGVNYIVVGMKKVPQKDGTEKWVQESREEKELKLLQIANGEYDMVLMSRDTFSSIDFSEKTKEKMMKELVNKYYPEPDGNAGKLAKAKYERAMQNMAKMMTLSEDSMQGIYLENLGFDMIVRDEAHDCKNLLVPLEEEIRGVNSSQSQRAVHNLFATKVIRSMNDEGGVFTLTATPISNSPLEVFNMLVPVAEKELEGLGISNMDDFIKKFADRVIAPVTDADGRVVMKEKFGGWLQPEALRKLFFRFTDYKTKDDVQSVKANIKFPDEKPNHIFSQLNPVQKDLMRHCQLRLWNLRFKKLDKNGKWVLNTDGDNGMDEYLSLGFITPQDYDDIKNYFESEYIPTFNKVNAFTRKDDPMIDDGFFQIQSDMIKITSDLEWYAGTSEKRKGQLAVDNSSLYAKKISEALATEHADLEKVQQLRNNVLQIYKNGGKQLVFAINTKLHDKLLKQFVDAGIPESEIKIVNGMTAKDSIMRAQISDDFNSGKYKVIIGNYSTMGEGLNFNKMTSDVHHLQPAWNHLQIEQGNGRAIRQGNDLDFVNTHYYLSKGSIDAFMNQKIQDKGNMVEKFMRGDINSWDSDVELSPEEMMIALAENPETAKRLIEAQNIALANAIKEKERIGNYRKLSQAHDLRTQMQRSTDRESRQFKQLEQEYNRISGEVSSEFKDFIALDTRPIILPNHNAVIKVGSVIRFGSSDDSLAVVKGYTHSTGRVLLETWDSYEGSEERILALKDFEQQYGKTIEKVDTDIHTIFDNMIKRDKTSKIKVISKLPKDILKKYKADILDNMKEDDTEIIYKDLDGKYEITNYSIARDKIANEGGRIIFPQEDSGIVKFLHNAINEQQYQSGNYSYYNNPKIKAERVAKEMYGEKYKTIIKKLAKGEKELAISYEIPMEGEKFFKKLGELANKGYSYQSKVDEIKRYANRKNQSDWDRGRLYNRYTELLKSEYMEDIFGATTKYDSEFIAPNRHLTTEEIERAIAIDDLARQYDYGFKETDSLESLINSYGLIKKKEAM